MKAAFDRESPPLFPILPRVVTGLPRMAAEAEHLSDGHLVEFRTLKVSSLLNRSVSKRMSWLAYSINPYRGCEFGCRYCYARYTHEFLSTAEGAIAMEGSQEQGRNLLDPETFERLIFLKQNAAWLLEQELKRIDPAQQIAIGTATDPYQPIERKECVTRSLLEVFARRQGYRIAIVTKSNLIERDIDLLSEIVGKNTLAVNITITTPDADLARKLEPRAPRPDLRFQTVRRLSDAGIPTGILCCPLLPGITDSEAAIDEMARLAAAAHARFFAANPLFLKPCSRPTYLAFLQEHFPGLLPDHEVRFGKADFASAPYKRELARRVENACRKYGLGVRFNNRAEEDALEPSPGRMPPEAVGPMQQRLFG